MKDTREVWQRGPVKNIPALLQPVAHALLQAREELEDMMKDFPGKRLWERPAGVASPAFHLQHLTGVLNRLFTYSNEKSLTAIQLYALQIEGNKEKCRDDLPAMLALFHSQVNSCLEELSKADINTLTNKREIGRHKIPTTLLGLYVHAAEHTMRHIGQLMVTVKVIQSTESRPGNL